MKVLITGAAGMLGVEVAREMQRRSGEVILTSRVERSGEIIAMNVCSWDSVVRTFAEYRPELVLHLAAETDVDRCEMDHTHAYTTNTFGTENIALACQKFRSVMVYVSTANVFDGHQPEPYVEYDTPGSLNVYGCSKLRGEQIVSQTLNEFFIFRTGWLVGGWEIDKKFVYKMVQLSRFQEELKVVNDRFGSPTFTVDFAKAMADTIETQRYGLYHLVNQGFASRWEIACEVVRLLGRDRETKVIPVSSDEFPLPAPRPQSEMMRSLKLELMDIGHMPHWKDSLRAYINENKHKDLGLQSND